MKTKNIFQFCSRRCESWAEEVLSSVTICYLVRAVRVSLLRRGEAGDVPGPGRAPTLQGSLQVHPPPRVLPRPAQPTGGRAEGGGHHVLRQDEDLRVAAGGGRDTGRARPEEHLRPRDAPQHKVQLGGRLQEILRLCDRSAEVRTFIPL